VDVTAQLDSSGRLTITERQTIVLSGDWNGPERTFVVAPGQTHRLLRLTRVDRATRSEHELTEGDLTKVDEYRWFDGHVLRWRSRLPSAPVYRNDTLSYTLVHAYDGILLPRTATDGSGGAEYLMDHDFAFRDRAENVERFSLKLVVDSAWKVPAGFTWRVDAGPLRPGEGYVVSVPLRFARAGRPAGVVVGAGALVRLALLGALVAAVVLLFLRFLARERTLGRFASPPESSEITREWLEQHVFSLAPEVVGAAWDDTTAAPEVAATLARLVADGKLASEVVPGTGWVFRSDVLHLRLLVPRDALTGHDRALIDALFIGGADRTSTDDVRAHYRATGFDAAALIEPFLRARLDDASRTGRALPSPSPKPTRALLAAALVVYATSAMQRGATSLMSSFVVAFLWYAFTAIQARGWRTRVVRPAPHLLRVLIPMALWLSGVGATLLDQRTRVGALALLGLALFTLGLVNSVFNLAASRHDADRIALRKTLAGARDYFERELHRPSPALLDAWFPWIIGFGLGPRVDRWFRAFGAPSSHSHHAAHATRSAGPVGGGGWSGFGGGGGFSGGGSSASFAAAVGGMAAAVPTPSRSGSSGGGRSGGGGRAGGGGGGGW